MKRLMVFLTIFAFLLMSGTAIAAADADDLIPEVWGGKRIAMFNVDFDSSYPTGGESISLGDPDIRFSDEYHVIIESHSGYKFEWDYGNNKIKVFSQAPPIVYEEKQELADTSSATGFTLDYPAAFIVSLVSSGGTAYPIIYSGETTMQRGAATLSAPIQDGVRTGVSVNPISWAIAGNTNFYVTYATQAWEDLHGLLVQNELMGIPGGTGVTRTTVSGNSIFAWGWGKQDGATTGVTPIDLADTAAAGEMGIDYGNNADSGATHAYNLVATSAVQYYATYLKEPEGASWLHDRWINDEDSTSGTSTVTFDRSLLLWLTHGYHFNNASASLQIVLQDQPVFFSGTGTGELLSGVSEIKPNWGFRGDTPDLTSLAQLLDDEQVWTVHEVSVTTEHGVYIHGHPWEIPNLKFLEVKNGSDLSNLTDVKVLMIGR